MQVCGNFRVYGNCRVYGNFRVYGNMVCGVLYGNCRVYGNTVSGVHVQEYGNCTCVGNYLNGTVTSGVCAAPDCWMMWIFLVLFAVPMFILFAGLQCHMQIVLRWVTHLTCSVTCDMFTYMDLKV